MLIKVRGYVYESSQHYANEQIARCRGGMCPYFNYATFIEYDSKTDMNVGKCLLCSEKRANTGSFPVV